MNIPYYSGHNTSPGETGRRSVNGPLGNNITCRGNGIANRLPA